MPLIFWILVTVLVVALYVSVIAALCSLTRLICVQIKEIKSRKRNGEN